MDRFVPQTDDSSEMTRHLRPVPDSPDEAVYVVGRSQHVRPGSPFVLARCVDRGVAVVFALAGQQVCTRDEMRHDPSLMQALEAWESGDDTLFRMERKARAAFGRQDRKDQPWHPSRVGRAQT
jgi:hypothetical protein